MMEPDHSLGSPISLEDLQKIDSTGLSLMERHYLRLLAHCLACFREMGSNSSSSCLPDRNDQLKWCLAQPRLASEATFINTLLEQFAIAADRINQLAANVGKPPLDLTLDDLIESSVNRQN